MSVNNTIGDPIRTDIPSDHYKNGWEAIWGKAKTIKVPKCKVCHGVGYVWGMFYDPPEECQACLDQEPSEQTLEVTSEEDEAWKEMERK